MQCSILIAVISRLQYTNSLLSTNFTNTSFSKHKQTPNYLHCRYFRTTIIQNIFGHASNQILVQGRRTIENSSLERLATSCAGIWENFLSNCGESKLEERRWRQWKSTLRQNLATFRFWWSTDIGRIVSSTF